MQYFLYDRKKTALIFKDKEYSYSDLLNNARYYNSKLNISIGDRVVLFTENRPEFIYCFFGIIEKGGISVNIDSGYNAEELSHIFIDSTPKYVFTSNKNYNIALEAKKIANSNVNIIVFDENEDNENNLNILPDSKPILAPPMEQTIVILYTSGTTGTPKGVMLTYGNILTNLLAVQELELLSEKDRMLSFLPFHHILPLAINILMPLYLGSLVVISNDLSSESIKASMNKYKITAMIGVPRVWEMFHKGIMGIINSKFLTRTLFKICAKIQSPALSKTIFSKIHNAFGGHMRLLASGGAKLEKEILNDFTTMGFFMLEGYGMTETSPLISFNRPGHIRGGSVGFPLPGIEIKISDENEVLVKGPNIMKGYFNQPQATSEVISRDGWFHTGDLGRFHDNHLILTGRKKEMIVLSNGKNINPGDIESELMKKTSLIKEIGVVEHNKHLLALIYPDFELAKKEGIVNIKEEIKWQIIDHYNITAPNYRKILETRIVSIELPKTRIGKLQRFKLQELILSEKKPEVKEELKNELNNKYINTKEYVILEKYFNNLHEVDRITPDSHLEIDLGMDSLDNVELLSYISTTFQISITEEDFSNVQTVKELITLIINKGGDFKEGEVNWKNIFDEKLSYTLPKFNKTICLPFDFLSKLFFKTYIKLKKVGIENLSDSPTIFVGNHQSMLDAFAFTQILSSNLRKKTYFMASNIHFSSDFKIWVAKNSNVILLDMNKNIKDSLKISAKVLNEGNNLVIFPEGARARDGKLQDFKKSFAILSKELNVNITPFAIKNAYNLMPYGKSFPIHGSMEIEVLSSISPSNHTIDELVLETRNSIKKVVFKEEK